MLTPEKELKGGKVNYYLAQIEHPQREEQSPYQAECEDIIEALSMTPNEANIFKAIWRSAAARLGNGKPDHKALYDAQKIVHYGQRIVRKLELQTKEEPKTPTWNGEEWIPPINGSPYPAKSGEAR